MGSKKSCANVYLTPVLRSCPHCGSAKLIPAHQKRAKCGCGRFVYRAKGER